MAIILRYQRKKNCTLAEGRILKHRDNVHVIYQSDAHNLSNKTIVEDLQRLINDASN